MKITMEIMEVRKATLKVMEFLIYNKIDGFTENELLDFIKKLAKFDESFEGIKARREWAEENVFKREVK